MESLFLKGSKAGEREIEKGENITPCHYQVYAVEIEFFEIKL